MQQVTTTSTGADVQFWAGPGALERTPDSQVPIKETFTVGKPWFDVIALDGTVIGDIVELGHLP